MIILSLALYMVSAQQWLGEGKCTFHPYESDKEKWNIEYDNSPGWCGIRYSMLNVARITAINGMNSALCNQCIQVQGSKGGPFIYVLAVDYKEAPGLDIAKSSFQALFPKSNPFDPQICRWRVVNPKYCGKICIGSEEECTPGSRNLLPASLLPTLPKNRNVLSESEDRIESPRSNDEKASPEKDTVSDVPIYTVEEATGVSVELWTEIALAYPNSSFSFHTLWSYILFFMFI
jgi:hypothetical protein